MRTLRSNPLHVLAAAVAAAGLFSGPIHGKPLALNAGTVETQRQSSRRLMLAGGIAKSRGRKPWAFRGKNRAQRNRLATAFCNF